MPRHLISDAHEWINEIPTVPIYYLAKPQPRERAWQNQRGKKTLDVMFNGAYRSRFLAIRIRLACVVGHARYPVLEDALSVMLHGKSQGSLVNPPKCPNARQDIADLFVPGRFRYVLNPSESLPVV